MKDLKVVSALMFPFILLLFCTTASAFSCTCEERQTVKRALTSTHLVFIGQVVETDIFSEKEGVPITRVRIGKIFKGESTANGMIDLAQGLAGSCGRYFGKDHQGTEWLFYVDAPQQTTRWNNEDNKYEISKERYYAAHTCGRTRPIALANDDLAYLNQPEKYEGKTRVSGMIGRYGQQGAVSVFLRTKEEVHRTSIDRTGYFEFFDFPAGDHVLELELDKGTLAYPIIPGGFLELENLGDEKANLHKIELKFTSGQHHGIDFSLRKELSTK